MGQNLFCLQWGQLKHEFKLIFFLLSYISFFFTSSISIIIVVKFVFIVFLYYILFSFYNVVKERGDSMFVRAIKNNKGDPHTYFCALVQSYRDETGTPKHRVLINFGLVPADSVPYLKAAFSKNKPKLVYEEK